jgi:UDP-N-acetylmuramoyl-L-alanyl-D-glutamate--2,6-diaminopimelate ligase
VKPGDLFIAISGFASDGHAFIDDAIQKGAAAVLVEKDIGNRDVPVFRVQNSREAAALLSHRFYGEPSKSLLLLGITGTNGKTTVSFLLESILKHAGYKTGLVGTLFYRWGDHEIAAVRTTPDSVNLNRLLWQMRQEGVQAVSMEVSSHALALQRIKGMVFKGAVFTNLSRDHLDFHASIEDYCKTKSQLFNQLNSAGVAVVNGDDAASRHMVRASNGRSILYGRIKSGVDYSIESFEEKRDQTRILLKHQGKQIELITPLIGTFNIMNVTAAAVLGLEIGIEEAIVRRGIEAIRYVKGRMEKVDSRKGYLTLIDYAHTPDALANVLRAARNVTNKRLLLVFGCGGDRDKGKRMEMGKISESLADLVILTSDNPRTEDPETILQDILKGIQSRRQVETIPDRKQAIYRALDYAREGDTVLIAGKGHETYQEIGAEKIPFNDREVVEFYFNSREEK